MATDIIRDMYPAGVRAHAVGLVALGGSLSQVARATGIARSTIRTWTVQPAPAPGSCFRCADASPARGSSYAALLGFYRGDGCVSTYGTHTTLRVSCDATYPGIVADVVRLIASAHPDAGAFRVRAPGTIVVQGNWKHWPCLFPQHGPGREHERPIVLEEWQREIVIAFPGDFLRGLFHSDGARVENRATRVVPGEPKRYDYARWQFSNRSADIRDLCCWALDLVEVPWRASGPWTISVSRRGAVEVLDVLVGPKS